MTALLPPDMVEISEMTRLLIVIGILIPNAYTDIRYRLTCGRDAYYAAAAVAGAFLFLVAEGGWSDMMGVFGIIFGLTVVFVMLRARAGGSGDLIIMTVIIFTLPAYGGAYFVGVIIIGCMLLATGVASTAYNVALNVLQVARPLMFGNGTNNSSSNTHHHHHPGGGVFAAYPAAGRLRRACCLFACHQKRSWETFVVPVADDGRGSFCIGGTANPVTSIPTADTPWPQVAVGRLVVTAAPMVVFLLAAAILIPLILPGVMTRVGAVMSGISI